MTSTLYPKEFAFADKPLALMIGLRPRKDGWGLLFCVDDDDLHYTVAGSGDFLRTLLDLPPDHDFRRHPPVVAGRLLGVKELPPETFPLTRRGWPDEWKQRDIRTPWDSR